MPADLQVLMLALGLEIAVGDPVTRLHPVALFGAMAAKLLKLAPRRGRLVPFLWGGLFALGAVGAVGISSALALAALHEWSPVASLLVGAALLKTSFSFRQLEREALRVGDQLAACDLDGARFSLRALVSRDTSELTPGLLVSAAVESLAENLSDSFVAPLLWFALFGVPGALAYRAINTLDAMIGYHGPYEYLGKVTARLDDLVNLVPARVTALLLVLGAGAARLDWKGAWTIGVRDHRRTESPNAGWPMAVMAGALGIQLEKVGHYCLGDRRQERAPILIRKTTRALRASALILAVGVAAILLIVPR